MSDDTNAAALPPEKERPEEQETETGPPADPPGQETAVEEKATGDNDGSPLTDSKTNGDAPVPANPPGNASDRGSDSDAKDDSDAEQQATVKARDNAEQPPEEEGEEEEEEEDDNEESTDDDEGNHVADTASLKQEAKGEDMSLPFVEVPEEEEGEEEQSIDFDIFDEGEDSGTEDEQAAFMVELERFHKQHHLEFKAPKFYGKELNCLKLWRQVTSLGGYDQVTVGKLWRQVGESFRPPKTCTTVSWSFRIFYEKALLEYEKHKVRTGQLHIPISSLPDPNIVRQIGGNQSPGPGRARRDAAARAMQGWHMPRVMDNGEVGDPIIKDKSSISIAKRGVLKRKNPSSSERPFKFPRTKGIKSEEDSIVIDVGPPAHWVKVNVRQTKDCFEIFALVPGLLREEVHVQSDPAGRLVISGDPEQPDNPWGVTPFKKVINLPSRIDPHQTSAVVTLHGQLFVRAPFEHSDI